MSKKLYVYSTLTSDVAYTPYDTDNGNDTPVARDPVVIKGGAGVVNDRLITPRGVVTEVTEEQAELLRQNKVFQLHEKNGFVVIDESKTDPDNVAADMQNRDRSAPLVEQDFAEGEAPTVSTSEPKPDKHRNKR